MWDSVDSVECVEESLAVAFGGEPESTIDPAPSFVVDQPCRPDEFAAPVSVTLKLTGYRLSI